MANVIRMVTWLSLFGIWTYGYMRLWLDGSAQPHVLFTSNDQDGLFRWGVTP